MITIIMEKHILLENSKVSILSMYFVAADNSRTMGTAWQCDVKKSLL